MIYFATRRALIYDCMAGEGSMHIPDGFLDAKTALATAALAAAGVGIALRQCRLHLPQRRVPLMGLGAAFVFAAQMLNFPVPGGTSGHMCGGVLAAVLLGPSAAIVVMTAVLIVQCLMFADGGLLALGANIFNLGIVHCLTGYAIYGVLRRLLRGNGGRLVAAGFGAWCATVLTAIVCAGELALSGRLEWHVGFSAMAGAHMLIGIGEAAITMMVLAAVLRNRPELVRGTEPGGAGRLAFAGYGLLVCIGLGLFVAPFASPLPDGLESVAERLGFADRAAGEPLLAAPAPEYQMPGFRTAAVATAVAGAAGTVVIFVLVLLFARLLVRRSPAEAEVTLVSR